MKVLIEKQAMRSWSRDKKRQGFSVAFVPTMGCLHEGHLALVTEAKMRADVVVVSIYVNPAQFGPTEDFSIYPRDVQGDIAKLEPLGVDVVFNPYDLYERGESGIAHETWIRVEKLEEPLCGRSRPHFFRGVATVVTKLFHIVEPDVALFGKKDYQQWRVISRLVRDLDMPIQVVGCELVREPDGLAMSSRNLYLSSIQRAQALSISLSLMKVKAAVANGTTDTASLIDLVQKEITDALGKVDYVEVVDQESLQHLDTIDRPAVLCVAAYFGKVRLVDNIELEPLSKQID